MKQLFVGVLSLTTMVSMAQKPIPKPFKVDVSLGYGKPLGNDSKAGLLFSIEPKYSLTNRITVGFRIEASAINMMGKRSDVNYSSEASSFTKLSSRNDRAESYVLTADYYLSKGKIRPFVGAGFGLYKVIPAENLNFQSGSYARAIQEDKKIGGLIRAGVEAGHFRLSMEYNLVPKSAGVQIVESSANGVSFINTPAVKNSYLGIKLGVTIGGGRKNK